VLVKTEALFLSTGNDDFGPISCIRHATAEEWLLVGLPDESLISDDGVLRTQLSPYIQVSRIAYVDANSDPTGRPRKAVLQV